MPYRIVCGNNPLIYTDPTGHIFGIDDLLAAVIVGSVVGAVSAGEHSHWNVGTMLAGAVIGGIAGAVGFSAGSWAFGAVGKGAFGLLVGGVVGGATGGLTGGGLFAAAYGGDIGQGMLQGAEFGAFAGAVTGGLIGLGVPNTIAAAGGGAASGYAECGGKCAGEGAIYSFSGAVLNNALTIGGMGAQGKVPAQGTPEWEKMHATNATYVTTPEISLEGKNSLFLLVGLLGNGYSHTWHTQDAGTGGDGYVPTGHYYRAVQSDVPYPGQNYAENGWNNFSLFSNNCTTRVGFLQPASYSSNYNYYGQGTYWWRR